MENITVKKYLLWNIIGFGLSTTLQLAGFVTPGWFRSTKLGNREEHGIWYIVDCGREKDPCGLKSHDTEGDDYDPTKYLKIVSSLALIACLFVLVFLRGMWKYSEAAVMKRLPICAYVSLLSGLLSVLPAGSGLDFALTYRSEYMTVRLPYSAILTGIGGLLALVLSLFALIWMYLKQKASGEKRLQIPLVPIASHQEF